MQRVLYNTQLFAFDAVYNKRSFYLYSILFFQNSPVKLIHHTLNGESSILYHILTRTPSKHLPRHYHETRKPIFSMQPLFEQTPNNCANLTLQQTRYRHFRYSFSFRP